MARWLRRPTMIAAAAVLLAGCGSVPSASHPPGASPSATSGATATPAAGTAPGTPAATSSPGSPPAPVSTTATPAPFPWPSGAPTVGPGQVVFALLVVGAPAPGEGLSLYFQPPHVGQNEFQLCGGSNPCRPAPGQVYTWSSRNLPAGASPWAFQKSLNGTTSTIRSGTVDAAQGAVVTATVAS